MGLRPGLVFGGCDKFPSRASRVGFFRKANRRLPQGVEVAGVESLGEDVTVFQDATDAPRLAGALPDRVHQVHQVHDRPEGEPVGVLLG